MNKKYTEVSELRYLVPRGTKLTLVSDKTELQVLDYSNAGFLIRCTSGLFDRGTQISADKILLDGEELPVSGMILPLKLEVIWSKQDAKTDALQLGVKITNSNEINREFLCDLLRDYLDEPEPMVGKLSKTG